MSRIFITLVLTLSVTQFSFGQEKENKINAIIDSLEIAETQKTTLLEYNLEPLKYQAIEEDSIKLIEIENQLTDEEIRKRVIKAFNEIFTDEEINELYSIINSSVFYKFFKSPLAYNSISDQFKDITAELDRIADHIEEYGINEPIPGPELVPIDREDGFYATINYNSNMDNRDLILEEKPVITTEDILEVKKEIDDYGNLYINVTLNEGGANKFYLLTKENIGKPIAIVIDKHIVIAPIVHNPISKGKIHISGYFSEEEIDRMIQKLNDK